MIDTPIFEYQTLEAKLNDIQESITEFAQKGWRVVGFTCVATAEPWLFVALLERKKSS
jgi:hypothetical protein